MTKATMIPMTATQGQSAALRTLLSKGRDLVAENEPATLHWFALQQEGSDGEVAIFDLFTDQAGREAHFDGDVAAALAERSPVLVEGGWDDGVVANVRHFETIAVKAPSSPAPVTKATYISLQAAPGQADALARFLSKGGELVTEGEPDTLYWYALRSETDDHRFAIVDLFANQAGRDAHFAGDVAAALRANAETLLVGGWEAGVLDNVVHFDVIAAK